MLIQALPRPSDGVARFKDHPRAKSGDDASRRCKAPRYLPGQVRCRDLSLGHDYFAQADSDVFVAAIFPLFTQDFGPIDTGAAGNLYPASDKSESREVQAQYLDDLVLMIEDHQSQPLLCRAAQPRFVIAEIRRGELAYPNFIGIGRNDANKCGRAVDHIINEREQLAGLRS